MKAPSTPPLAAHGLSTGQAQQWVLVAAICTAVIYTFRRIVEPTVTNSPAKGSKTAALLGAGSPPPPLGQWAVAWGTTFVFLSVIALGAPELAGGIAMLALTGSLIANGLSLASDLNTLETPTTTKKTG